MRLYHWTPAANLRTIRRFGLRPQRSIGCRPRVWLCDGSRLAWALTHVAQHHGVNPDAMALVVVEVPTEVVRPFLRPGVFVAYAAIRPDAFLGTFTGLKAVLNGLYGKVGVSCRTK